jgi:putative acetyltransferase
MIRTEVEADVPIIRSIHEIAYPSPAEADLVDRLRESGRLAISLVAEVQKQVIGHVALSPVTLDPEVAKICGASIGPVAVLPDHRGKGIAGNLIQRSVTLCREAGFNFLVVLGDPEYYRCFGFRPASPQGLGNEFGAAETFMAIELNFGALSSCKSTVRYAEEFAGV